MAYLDNKTIVVDAILTQKGREIVAKNGNLNITSFALADDEIDYSLYNPNANTSELMDVALINTPVFEPNTNETQTMKYKLVTLDEGSTYIPVVSIVQSSIVVDASYTGQIYINPSTSPATYNTNLGYTAILSNSKIGSLVVTTQAPNLNQSATVATFAGDVVSQTSQTVVGMAFSFVPNSTLKTTTTTTLTIIGNESGGGVSIPVTVTVNQ